jgi:hypothetical protein
MGVGTSESTARLCVQFLLRAIVRLFYVSLTVHLTITLANDQLGEQFFNTFTKSCTCFEQYLTHS